MTGCVSVLKCEKEVYAEYLTLPENMRKKDFYF